MLTLLRSYIQQTLTVFYVPGTVLGPENVTVIQRLYGPCLKEFTF